MNQFNKLILMERRDGVSKKSNSLEAAEARLAALKRATPVRKSISEDAALSAFHKSRGVSTIRKSGSRSYELMRSMASNLRKTEPELTEAMAFEKVFTAPENASLRNAYRQENPANY